MKNSKNILVSPLDWGLGHASRCIPIIELLLKKGAQVILAADGASYDLLRREFPKLKMIRLPGYNISYPQKGSMAFHMLKQIPRIYNAIRKEHRVLKQIIRDEDIDVVISDNRFGLWNKQVYSIYMTHQLMIKCSKGFSFFEPFLHMIHKSYITKYDECWIPDYEGKVNLSGDLSHQYKQLPNSFFIGPLSRFSKSATQESSKASYKLLAILSGPEPQRGLLENKVKEQFKQLKLTSCIVRGLPSDETDTQLDKLTRIKGFATSTELHALIQESDIIVCRSGYSSIMDLFAMRKKAILIPTPGQTEQEYLAEYLQQHPNFTSLSQEKMNIAEAMKEVSDNYAENIQGEHLLLEERIDSLLK